MTNKILSAILLEKNEEKIVYAYHASYDSILVDDLSYAGIIELDSDAVYRYQSYHGQQIDSIIEAITLFQDKKMRIIKLCNQPDLSEYKEDYQAIIAASLVIKTMMNRLRLPRYFVSANDEQVEMLKQNPVYREILSRAYCSEDEKLS